MVCQHPPHDDVIKWKHFPLYWPFVRGIHRSPVNSRHKGHWRGALIFSLVCVCLNGWVNKREAGGWIRLCALYDVIVMTKVTDSNNISSMLPPVCWRTNHGVLVRPACELCSFFHSRFRPRPWFNIKMSYQYRKSHCGDKTVVISSYLHNGSSYTGKMPSSSWMGALSAVHFALNSDIHLPWSEYCANHA